MRVVSCSLLSVALTSSVLFGGINAVTTAAPFQLAHASPQMTTAVDILAVTNALSDYYENIVDQVMVTLTEEITLSAPHSFMSIHHLGSVHRSKCRTSFRSFVHALRDHLNLMRSNLLASIRPLVESNLPAVLEHKDTAHQHILAITATTDAAATTTGLSGLTEDILILNRHIGNQLGLIVNMDEAADIIINQSIPASLFDEYVQQEVAVIVVSRQKWRLSNNKDQLIMMGVQQQQQQQQQDDAAEDMMVDPAVWLDTLRREQEEQQQQEQRPESKVLSSWLRSWLAEIEHIISVQFDERVQDATQSILEDFLLDD